MVQTVARAQQNVQARMVGLDTGLPVQQLCHLVHTISGEKNKLGQTSSNIE
jgi:hypothetical protein